MAASASSGQNSAENGARTFSLVQAASILGVHRNTLSKWVDQGCPVQRRADRSRGVEWEILIADVVDWRIRRAVQDAAADPETAAVGAERARLLRARADLAEIERDRRAGKVALIEDVTTIVTRAFLIVRNRFLAWPARHAHELAATSDPNEVRAILDSAVRELLTEISQSGADVANEAVEMGRDHDV